jgi:hypothetical protein
MNTFGYESLNEIFFDVYEIKVNGLDLVKEKKGDYNGNPIIEMDIRVDNEIYKNVRFVLTKENKICINPNLLDHTKVVAYEKKVEKPKETPKPPVIKENKEVFVKQKNKIVQKDPVIEEENLIEKTKKEFFESIRGEVLQELKKEIKAGIISDLIKENVQINFDSVVSDNGNKNKLQKILENYNNSLRKDYIELAEKVSRREAMRYTESGGGTNSVQYANGGKMDGDLFVTGNFQSKTIMVDRLNVDSLTANYGLINHDLTVAGSVSSHGEHVLGDVLITGNLKVLNQIDAGSITVNNLIEKSVKNISGSNFVNGNYTVSHNLNTYDLLLTLYSVNPDGKNELVHASMINDSLSTTLISFAEQPDPSENYKLIIVS